MTKLRLRTGLFTLGISLSLVLSIPSTGAAQSPDTPQTADTIFHGGPILTMAGTAADGSADPQPEAVAVAGERIVSTGDLDRVMAYRGDQTRVVDLDGRALLPGFIDAHGHLTFQARTAAMADLQPPPAGPVSNIAQLQAALQEQAKTIDAGPGDWLVGSGYDDSLLAEQRHPTKFDLDDLFPLNPVALIHVSGHLAVANSKALDHLGYDDDTPDPEGGVIRRVEGSNEPNGVLEETAIYSLFSAAPAPDLDTALALLERAQTVYARHGLTTAQDGATDLASLGLLQQAAAKHRLFLDVITYPRGTEVRGALENDRDLEKYDFGDYNGRLKVGGIKLVLDGSPQGKTAFLSQPFEVPPDGQGPDYRGYPIMNQDVVNGHVDFFHQNGVRMLAHANGDAAGDQLIQALRHSANKRALGDHRTVMIHSQIMRPEQLEALADLGVVPSFFVAHTFFWGDWHRDSVLGPRRADFISPLRSAQRLGIPFTIHNDAPIVPPDVMRLVWTAVNRRTRSGDILGPKERVGVMTALRATTINAARQHFEEDSKGSIEVGKQADLVILESDPRDTKMEDLADLQVVETFARGKSVYKAGQP